MRCDPPPLLPIFRSRHQGELLAVVYLRLDREYTLAELSRRLVSGTQANDDPWLERASRTADTAESVAEYDRDSAFVLAYDAARQACCGLLAQQGLRPTTHCGHYAVEEIIRAQFGPVFRDFGGCAGAVTNL